MWMTIAMLLAGGGVAGATAPAAGMDGETAAVPVLRNGGFTDVPDPKLGPLPWWRVIAGAPVTEDGLLVTTSSDIVQQPLPAWAGAVDELVIRGRMWGQGTLTLVDGAGGSASQTWVGRTEDGYAFEVLGSHLAANLMRPVEPRLTLQLTGGEPGEFADTARWGELEVLARFPAPTEAELRADLIDLLDWSFGEFLDRALDDLGPRPTAFVAREFDADTGQPVGAPMPRVTYHPLYGQLLRAWAAEPRADWGAALERYLRDFLDLGLNPETGLPHYWDPLADQPLDDAPIEIRIHLEFLLDAAEHGPEALRAECLAAASRIGEQVLAHGVMPDGSVAPRYLPATGLPSAGTVPIRRLDVPAALARLGAILGDRRYLDAAREAVLELAYDHYWPGTWDRIDPGFDDNYGHYGERAAAMWKAWPEEAVFRDLAISGFDRYAPLWRDALRYGGNIAADQVRCWHIFSQVAELDPSRAQQVRELLDAAVHVHLCGQQTGGGTWIDVTVVDFSPQRLPVGDTAGVPQNLLEGLGLVYDEALGQRTETTRAQFAGVLLQTVEAFGGPHGLIGTGRRASLEVGNPARGSLRLHPGLITMLEQLDP